MSSTLDIIKNGFNTINIEQEYKDAALQNIERWLNEEEFKEYVPQINYLTEIKNWDLLLDCFYQVIPFGTGGRRGPVGIGPNRINIWTIQTAAQGHSQYLLQKYGDEAKKRGVVITYDVRKYLKTDEYDNSRLNPIKDLDCKTLAIKEAEVYAANGIKVYMFEDYTPTPELSFMVRHLKAVGGNMLSASHNPPEHNGQKVVDEYGGQLIPPFDQDLVDMVVNEVKEIKYLSIENAQKEGLIKYVTNYDHQAYLDAASRTSLNPKYRSAKIYFSPFHGTSYKTFPAVFKKLGFDITSDPNSSVPDPTFSTITFNIPNPEVVQSYTSLIKEVKGKDYDIILVTDPDADRIGLLSWEDEKWQFYTGNEIGILVIAYMLEELTEQGKLKNTNTVAKTLVTTNFIKILADRYKIESVNDLLVGIKYIAVVMNELEKKGRINDFLIGVEESHGASGGDNYVRDKDALIPGILLGELASKLKDQGKTLGKYLNQLYEENGYYLNYLTEIRLPGAEGMSSIKKIQNHFREIKPKQLADFKIKSYTDKLDGSVILSATDKDSRNMLVLKLETPEELSELQVVIRPSGTEPKLKFYIEVGVNPNYVKALDAQKNLGEQYREKIEKVVVQYAYKVIGIDFPDRGFLLFWQLPAQAKMKYFEIEEDIASLKNIQDKEERMDKLNDLLKFLGSDPIEKINKAFEAKYDQEVLEYLELT